MARFCTLTVGLLLGFACTSTFAPLQAEDATQPSLAPFWATDYRSAMDAARQDRRMLVVLFHVPGDEQAAREFEALAAADSPLARRLREVARLQLATDAVIHVRGEPKTVLDDPSFAGLKHGPGLAMIDFTRPDTPRFGCVVATHRLSGKPDPADPGLAALLGVRREARPAPSPPASPPPQAAAPEPPSSASLVWLADYHAALSRAKDERRMLFIFFHGGDSSAASRDFEAKTLADPAVAEKLGKYVLLRLPADAKTAVDGKQVALLRQPAFAEMHGRPGVAMIDHCTSSCRNCGMVVSVFPFLRGRAYNVAETKVMLDLPPGTLTQRTMIYAVRTHPERPASTRGRLDVHLLREAERHSCHQARIRLQGHHAWESRFHRIRAMLSGGQVPSEVCAESWPGQGMLEAAIECVRCWRLSSGHWRAVSSPQQSYAYDMKRGDNGIWYATGIFGGNN